MFSALALTAVGPVPASASDKPGWTLPSEPAPAAGKTAARLAQARTLVEALEQKALANLQRWDAARRAEEQAEERADQPEAIIRAQELVRECHQALASCQATLDRSRAALVALEAAAGAEGTGLGATETKEESKAPGSDHPFFSASAWQVRGGLLRYTTAYGASKAGVPGRMVRCEGGSLYWAEQGGRGLGWLQPGTMPATLDLLQDDKDPKSVIHHLAADRDRVWCLVGHAGGGFTLKGVRGNQCFAAVRLPECVRDEPIGMVSHPGDKTFGPTVITPDWMLATACAGETVSWFPHERKRGPALRPGTRFLAVKRDTYFLDPASACYGRLEAAGPGGFKVEAVRPVPGLTPTNFAALDGAIYVTYRDRDGITRLQAEDLKLLGYFKLAAGTAPSAIVAQGGELVFATPGGFGRIAANGAVTRIPVRGGRVAPLELTPGPGSGKLYFTETGMPFINALSLAGEGSGDEPSLLAADAPAPAAGAAGEAKKARPGPASQGKPRRSAPAAGAGAPDPAEESKASAEPESSDPDPGADSGASAGTAAPALEAAVVRLVNRQITEERLDHILQEHGHSDTAGLAADGWAKGQFREDLTRDPRKFRKRLCRWANNGKAHFKGADDEVVLHTDPMALGRVRLAGAKAWSDTRRVRLVLRRSRDGRSVFLASAYPVPEKGETDIE